MRDDGHGYHWVWLVSFVFACSAASGTPGTLGPTSANSNDRDAAPDSAAAPPHVVTACPTSTGPSQVGSWQNITPAGISVVENVILVNGVPKSGFNTGANAFAFDPNNTATVYLGSCSQGIYKSTDCGATWVHINTGMNGPPLDAGRNWTLAVDPVDSSVYVNSGYGGSGSVGFWKSTNGGVDWTQLLGPGSDFEKDVPYDFVEFIAIDPTNHHHLLVSAHNACTGDVAGSGTCFANTTDGGATWKMVKGHPDMYFEGMSQAIIDANTWVAFSNGIFVTTDAGATWTKTPIPGSVTNGELYKAADGYYYVAASYGVAKSKDGISWAQIPGLPNSGSLAGDGTTMFTSYRDDTVPFYTSTGDYSVWKPDPGPTPPVTWGAWLMRYDLDHNLLYSSNETGGFWRVQTK